MYERLFLFAMLSVGLLLPQSYGQSVGQPFGQGIYFAPAVDEELHSPNGTFSVFNGPEQATGFQTTNVRMPWSQKLVEAVETNHNFGAVPAESKQEHVFEFINTTPDTLELVSVKASCGCTKPTILTKQVAPGESAKVLAQFQTRTFRGKKKATLTVGLNRVGQYRQYGEVQFSVAGKIRKDVVLTPGEVVFSTLSQSSAQNVQRVVKMKYAGSPHWRILDVKSSNEHLEVETLELSRTASGRVAYDLIVKLGPGIPVGAFEDELWITTNDRKTPQMSIAVSGNIKPVVEAAPINLGIVRVGAKIEKRFVVRGDKPFAIKEIRIGSNKVKFALGAGEKSLHVIPYSVDTSTAGAIREKLTVVTTDQSIPEKVVEFNVRVVAGNLADN